jgi:hypothetical protein
MLVVHENLFLFEMETTKSRSAILPVLQILSILVFGYSIYYCILPKYVHITMFFLILQEVPVYVPKAQKRQLRNRTAQLWYKKTYILYNYYILICMGV